MWPPSLERRRPRGVEVKKRLPSQQRVRKHGTQRRQRQKSAPRQLTRERRLILLEAVFWHIAELLDDVQRAVEAMEKDRGTFPTLSEVCAECFPTEAEAEARRRQGDLNPFPHASPHKRRWHDRLGAAAEAFEEPDVHRWRLTEAIGLLAWRVVRDDVTPASAIKSAARLRGDGGPIVNAKEIREAKRVVKTSASKLSPACRVYSLLARGADVAVPPDAHQSARPPLSEFM